MYNVQYSASGYKCNLCAYECILQSHIFPHDVSLYVSGVGYEFSFFYLQTQYNNHTKTKLSAYINIWLRKRFCLNP